MMPFERELAARDSEEAGCSGTTDFRADKMVTAIHCLAVNAPQVLGNEPDGGRALLKPKKLGMVGVSIRLAPKDRLGKKSFPPQGNEAAGVEVFRMQTPDSHCCWLSAAQGRPGPCASMALLSGRHTLARRQCFCGRIESPCNQPDRQYHLLQNEHGVQGQVCRRHNLDKTAQHQEAR